VGKFCSALAARVSTRAAYAVVKTGIRFSAWSRRTVRPDGRGPWPRAAKLLELFLRERESVRVARGPEPVALEHKDSEAKQALRVGTSSGDHDFGSSDAPPSPSGRGCRSSIVANWCSSRKTQHHVNSRKRSCPRRPARIGRGLLASNHWHISRCGAERSTMVGRESNVHAVSRAPLCSKNTVQSRLAASQRCARTRRPISTLPALPSCCRIRLFCGGFSWRGGGGGVLFFFLSLF